LRSLLLASFGFASFAFLHGIAQAQINHSGQRFPEQALAKVARGEAIPTVLGTKFPQVAAWYRQSETELHALCCRDKSLAADCKGRLHYACPGHPIPAGNGSATGPAAAFVALASDPLQLHSLPGAKRVIFLDFDGHTTTGTQWNTARNSTAPIVTPPYSIDGNAGNFSDTELANIQSIWEIIAEDFRPFNVDVTTEDPGLEAIRKTSSSDAFFGIRVCIGGSSMDWYGSGAGGIAYLDTFGSNTDTPAFVFPAQLGDGLPKLIADAASHEVGHTLGLTHDGQVGNVEYYGGHANWAPIMGSGYQRSVVHWSRGEYPSANNRQDDIAIIARLCPLRTDLGGDDIISASHLSGTTFNTSGLIETRPDADLFRFVAGSGTISFAASPSSSSPNLDIELSLYNGVGNLVTTATSPEMGAILSANLSQGTYYLAIDGVGTGSPTTAYNDYGSIGEYSLTGSAPAPSTQIPVALADSSSPLTGVPPLTVSFSSAGSSDPDGTISSYDWDFGNGSGSDTANPSFTFQVPGTYTVSLVVTDDGGVSSVPDTLKVVVLQLPRVIVGKIEMTRTRSIKGLQAFANVTVRDLNGAIRPGATVTARWSGLTNSTQSAVTNSSGVARFVSPRSSKQGIFTLSVTNISAPGFPYVPARNAEATKSISSR
jgi:PKD repeat protein